MKSNHNIRPSVTLLPLAAILLVAWTLHSRSTGFPSVTLVASTPAGPLMKWILGIPATDSIDFIRWRIDLDERGAKGTFVFNINFGEAQPNTRGFKGDFRYLS
ncbi:MAG TPA: hypothetical protein VGC95_01985 [Chitinophagaceae bacterium]